MFKSSGYVLLLGVALGMLERHTGYLRLQISKQFRAPEQGNIFAWLPKKMMQKNQAPARQLVDFIQPSKNSVILDIGPGFGFIVEHLLETYEPSQVYGVELSPDFFQGLQSKFEEPMRSGKLIIHNQDAIELNFLEDNSVDYVLAMNVVYFLNPLETYLGEFHRVLKPGGRIAFGVLESVERMDKSIFINVDWDVVVLAMKQVGFYDASVGEKGLLQIQGATSGTVISGSKSTAPVEEKPKAVNNAIPTVGPIEGEVEDPVASTEEEDADATAEPVEDETASSTEGDAAKEESTEDINAEASTPTPPLEED